MGWWWNGRMKLVGCIKECESVGWISAASSTKGVDIAQCLFIIFITHNGFQTLMADKVILFFKTYLNLLT